MTQHHRTAGTDYRHITISGKQYTLRPIRIGIYAEMESYIASQRPDPLAVAAESVKSIPPSHHAAVWAAAMNQAVANRTVTTAQASEFENSVDGLAWKVWQCLKQDHPEIDSIAAARNLLIEAGEGRFEELARAAEVASGEADLKKSSGPVEVPAGVDQDGPFYTGD